MPERSRRRHAEIAVVAVRVALVVALVPLLAAACGDDAGEDAADQPPTVTQTAEETTTETAAEEGATTRGTTTAASPPAPSGPVVRFRGNGDRVLPPVEVRRGGAALAWRNEDAVFSLWSDYGLVVDSVDPRGEALVPAGRRVLQIIASGGWEIEIRNARRVR